MAYALDIENPRVQFAMDELGISEEELRVKSLEDFAGPKVSTEIQEIRYEFHLKQLGSTISEIRHFLKHNQKIKRNCVSSSPKQLLSSNSRTSDLGLGPKEKNFLITTVSHFLASPKNDSVQKTSLEEKLSVIEPEKTSRLKEFEEKQKEKIREIRKQQMDLQKTYSEGLSQSLKAHEAREKLAELERLRERQEKEIIAKNRHDAVQCKRAQDDLDHETYIKEKLQQLEKRNQRSDELHQQYLNLKIGKVQQFRTVESLSENLKKIAYKNEVEQVNKLHEKHVNAYEFRRINEQMAKEEHLNKHSAFEKNRKLALEKAKQSELEFLNKAKQVHKKIVDSHQLVQMNREKMNNQLSIKQEIKRLKEKEKEMILARAKRRMDNKVNRTLERQIMRDERLEEMKILRAKEAEKTRDEAIKMMIQKERIREDVMMVSKSPNARQAQEKLRNWNLVKKPKTPELESSN